MKRFFILFFGLQVHFLFGQVNPLLSTTWNQTCYYNADCPTVGSGGACGKAYTGCNATAIAQIFKYYSYPESGMESHCNTNNVTHCVDFDAQTYDYTLMPNTVTSANPEVAKLMYHLGIAVDMQWSGTSSDSFFGIIPLKKYFKYSPKMYATATFMFDTTQDLIEGIKSELDAGRPVFAKGGSHFYLIDGYNLSDEFHMNFGWGGVYDNYYSITSVVNAGGTFTPTNFIFNIMPINGDLETAKDTIVVPANAGVNNAIEFTSLHDWTMSTDDSWIHLNLTSGNSGYYNLGGATFNYEINNGGVRYGYVLIDNGNDIDTVVIKQEASPLAVNPNNLSYDALGGTQTVSLSYYSWGTWNATASDTWITLSSASGTGNGGFDVIVATNPDAFSRNGTVVVSGGSFTDTIVVEQEANGTASVLAFDDESAFTVFPNPFTSEAIVQFSKPVNDATLELYNQLGQKIYTREHITGSSVVLERNQLEDGVYYLWLYNSDYQMGVLKLVVKD
ncbi:MAG: C10 family peptidase [Brumimicrobium sp.]|nr:C10 family peptidase [Brumimicrobium sp.]